MDATHGTATARTGGVALWAWIVAVALAVGLAILITIAALARDTAVAPVRFGDTAVEDTVNPRQDYVFHAGGPQGAYAQPQEGDQPLPANCHGQC